MLQRDKEVCMVGESSESDDCIFHMYTTLTSTRTIATHLSRPSGNPDHGNTLLSLQRKS